MELQEFANRRGRPAAFVPLLRLLRNRLERSGTVVGIGSSPEPVGASTVTADPRMVRHASGVPAVPAATTGNCLMSTAVPVLGESRSSLLESVVRLETVGRGTPSPQYSDSDDEQARLSPTRVPTLVQMQINEGLIAPTPGPVECIVPAPAPVAHKYIFPSSLLDGQHPLRLG